METKKIGALFAIIGGAILIIAAFLPAAYYRMVVAGYGYSVTVLIFYWFFGYYYGSIEISNYATYSETFSGTVTDNFGILCIILLIAGGAIGIVMGITILTDTLPGKIGGLVALIMASISIFSIVLWMIMIEVAFITLMETMGFPLGDVTFWEIMTVGPGVIMGFIGGAIVIVGGIISLVT